MDMVELGGSYYEIGELWGKAAKPYLKSVIADELGGLAEFMSVETDRLISVSTKLLPVAEQYDPEFIEVLKGMAKGADVPFEDIFALRTLLETMFYFERIHGMCTSFAVTGSATKDGSTIVGQNIDWHPGVPMSLFRISWPNGVKQLSLSLGGIWEYSISAHDSSAPFGFVSTLTGTRADSVDVRKPPINMVMSKASRQKRMVKALSEFINSQQSLASFILANGTGDIVGLEFACNQFEVIHPEKDILAHANHYLTDRFKPLDLFCYLVPDSFLRYYRLKKLIEEDYGHITPTLMMKKLADHNNYPNSLCAHPDGESPLPPSETVASVVMVPEKKEMYIATGNPCKNAYRKYTLDQEPIGQ